MSDAGARFDWSHADQGMLEKVADRLRSDGLEPQTWSNAAGDRYAPHSHAYEKVLICAVGSITFFVGPDENPVELGAGHMLVLRPGTVHSALVGPDGCTCIEGHREPNMEPPPYGDPTDHTALDRARAQD
jgi:quercetin dioxygenase-like cupin family protein